MDDRALNLGNKIVNTKKLRQRGAPVTNNEKGTRQINSLLAKTHWNNYF